MKKERKVAKKLKREGIDTANIIKIEKYLQEDENNENIDDNNEEQEEQKEQEE